MTTSTTDNGTARVGVTLRVPAEEKRRMKAALAATDGKIQDLLYPYWLRALEVAERKASKVRSERAEAAANA